MLGVLVVIHELGHFVTARLAGVRVLEFGLGFPPRAQVLRSEGETLYTLNWLPIGGFVRLEGEDGDSDDPRSFVRAPAADQARDPARRRGDEPRSWPFVIFFAIAWRRQPDASRSTFNERPAGLARPPRPASSVGDRIASPINGTRRSTAFDDPGGQRPSTRCAPSRPDGRRSASSAPTARRGRLGRRSARPSDDRPPTSGALGIESLRGATDRRLRPARRRRARPRSAVAQTGEALDAHLERPRPARRLDRQPSDRGAAGRRPGRHRQPGRRRLLAARAGLHAVPRRAPVGQPRPRQHPAVPAARRRPDAGPR